MSRSHAHLYFEVARAPTHFASQSERSSSPSKNFTNDFLDRERQVGCRRNHRTGADLIALKWRLEGKAGRWKVAAPENIEKQERPLGE
jgi:hypothetical protein